MQVQADVRLRFIQLKTQLVEIIICIGSLYEFHFVLDREQGWILQDPAGGEEDTEQDKEIKESLQNNLREVLNTILVYNTPKEKKLLRQVLDYCRELCLNLQERYKDSIQSSEKEGGEDG